MDIMARYWRLFAAVRQLKERQVRLAQPFCAQYAITQQQLGMLLTLYYEGAQTASGLARWNCIAEANNSAQCKKLAQAGLVERRRDSMDERQVLIRLTRKGSAAMREFQAERSLMLKNLESQVQLDEIERLIQEIERLAGLLDQNIKGETI